MIGCFTFKDCDFKVKLGRLCHQSIWFSCRPAQEMKEFQQQAGTTVEDINCTETLRNWNNVRTDHTTEYLCGSNNIWILGIWFLKRMANTGAVTWLCRSIIVDLIVCCDRMSHTWTAGMTTTINGNTSCCYYDQGDAQHQDCFLEVLVENQHCN